MSIQKKTLLAFFGVMATIAFSFFALSQFLLLNKFSGIERSIIEQKMISVKSLFESKIHGMSVSLQDYSVWDETYNYMNNRYQTYIDTNLSNSTISNLGLNGVFLVDGSGKSIFANMIDLESTQSVPVPADLTQAIDSGVLNPSGIDDPTKSGMLMISGKPLMVASHLIMRNNSQGTPAGVMIFVRYLDEPILADISSLAGQQVRSELLSEIGKGFDASKSNIPQITTTADNINGLIILSDIVNQPAMGLATSSPRTIYKQGLSSTLIFVGIIALIGWIAAFVLVFIYNRIIFKPLKGLRSTALTIATGDFRIQLPRYGKDEIGDVYQGFGRLLEFLNSMVNISTRISSGDLSTKVSILSDQDMLGISTNSMIDNLRATINTLITSAKELNQTSEKLVDTANLTGTATSQIAATIQEVAKGASQQSESVNKTAYVIDTMVKAIDGVAQGASEQASAVASASQVTADLADIIAQVENNANEVVNQSNEAASTTEKSSGIVHETLQGMLRIQESVSASNERVQVMGKQSDEIGEIVNTIDEIASQTNLLALNAAIEAARAETQANELVEYVLNRQMTSQARLVDTFLSCQKDKFSEHFWEDLGKKCHLDVILVTDEAGVISMSNDPTLLGFKFSDDPKEQTYAFRKLLTDPSAVVTQLPQKRAIDSKIFKFVGVGRSDKPGIIQVGFDAASLNEFKLQVGGFSVVANEVYRLAESSKSSAKNIANLVNQINKSVHEVTLSMKTSTDEVVANVDQAEKAKVALDDILAAFKNVIREAENAREASLKMTRSTAKLVESVDSVSAIVEENTAATEELSSGAIVVSQSVENIASVSEENSASVQEVSASATELDRQVQDLQETAQQLANLAERLQTVVEQFKLADL